MVYTYNKNSDGHYTCNQCNKICINQNTMHYHMKKHEDTLPFECTICNKQFLHASTLNFHKRIHNHEEQDREYKCPAKDCSFKGALTKANLLIHYVRKHCDDSINKHLNKKDNSIYNCTLCDKDMKSLTAFHYHSIKCIVPTLSSDKINEIKDIEETLV